MRAIILAAAIAGISSITPAYAFFTECTATKDVEMVDRPQGGTIGRWSPIKKGEKVAIRDTYQDWSFVLHFVYGNKEQYGWVQNATLANCRRQEGTP
jgi:hypothetical protein